MSEKRRIVVVIEEVKRNPFEIWLLAALFIGGMMSLLGFTEKPPSVQASLPKIGQLVWNLQIVSGAAAILIGIFWRHPVTSRTIQVAGNIWIAFSTLVYAFELFFFNGAAATLTGLLVFGVAISSVVRTIQLRQELKRIFAKAREQNGAGTLDNLNGGDYTPA